jgi:DNA polymerase III delta prime subunit
MALAGVPGSGKTLTALKIARGLVGPEGRIALIDTESDSALLYADQVDFSHAPLRTFLPRNYVKLIEDAKSGGFDALIVDSLTHSWNGKAGILEIAGGDFRGWKAATPENQALIEALVACRRKIHLIATLRSKIDYQVTNDGGKMQIRSVGLQPVHREDTPYEFDIVGHISRSHELTFDAGKSRYPNLEGLSFQDPGEDVAEIIKARLAQLNSNAL